MGEDPMRSALALVLLIALSAAADAATVRHSRAHHHAVLSAGVASSFAAVRGQTYPRPSPRVHYDDTPSYNDPSKLGGY